MSQFNLQDGIAQLESEPALGGTVQEVVDGLDRSLKLSLLCKLIGDLKPDASGKFSVEHPENPGEVVAFIEVRGNPVIDPISDVPDSLNQVVDSQEAKAAVALEKEKPRPQSFGSNE